MKVRTDFVTNSSSSSFIVATKINLPNDLPASAVSGVVKACGRAFGAGDVATNPEETMELFREWFGDCQDWSNHLETVYEMALLKLQQGYVLYTTVVEMGGEEWVTGDIIYSDC